MGTTFTTASTAAEADAYDRDADYVDDAHNDTDEVAHIVFQPLQPHNIRYGLKENSWHHADLVHHSTLAYGPRYSGWCKTMGLYPSNKIHNLGFLVKIMCA